MEILIIIQILIYLLIKYFPLLKFINKILSSFEQAMEKFKDKGVYLKVKILLVYSNETKKNNRYMTNNLFSFTTNTNTNNNNNKTTEGENGFKLKPLEMNVHKLICQKLKKKNEDISNNTKLIFEFYEIIDDTNKKEPKRLSQFNVCFIKKKLFI